MVLVNERNYDGENKVDLVKCEFDWYRVGFLNDFGFEKFLNFFVYLKGKLFCWCSFYCLVRCILFDWY